jgi:hypothetical protein
MTRVILLFLLVSTPAWAERVMKCDGFYEEHIYRHQNTFFNPGVEKRTDGKWTKWCSEGKSEIFEDGAICITEKTINEPAKEDHFGYKKGDKINSRSKVTLDFRFYKRSVDMRPLKPDMTEYEDKEGPKFQTEDGKSMKNAMFDCEKM